jgi:integrase/recombinase XerD
MGAVLRLPTVVSPSLEEAVAEFLADQQLRGLSPRTLTWFRVTLGPVLRYLTSVGCAATEAVTAPMVRQFLVSKQPEVGPRRLNHYRDAVRLFYDWAIAQGYAATNPAANIAKVREPRKIIPTFTEEEVEVLLCQPDTATFLGLRDQVFMLFLLDTGVRISEALGLRLPDLDLGTLTAKVLGKGNKERPVAFSPYLAQRLNTYLAQRASALGAVGLPDPLWVFVNQHGLRCDQRAMHYQLKAYGKQAGITRVRVSAHTFRHTFAVWFVRHGGSPFHLQKCLGHSDLAMSRRYCELADVDFLTKQRELSPLGSLNLGAPGRSRLPRASAGLPAAGGRECSAATGPASGSARRLRRVTPDTAASSGPACGAGPSRR